jgi:excisionase family DNA binding protein
MAQDGYCTVARAAFLGGIGAPRIYQLAKQGKLRHRRMGTRWFVLQADVMTFFNVDQTGRPVDPATARKAS